MRTPQRIGWLLRTWLGDKRGNVAAMMALMLVPVVGALAMGAEASNWFLTSRSLQNAADSAVIAAAQNSDTTSVTSGGTTRPRYDWEARGILASYGVSAGGGSTVNVVNTATCPDATPGCYQVTLTRQLPVYLTRIVGFNGDSTLNGQAVTTVTVSAMAKPTAVQNTFCLLSLAAGGPATVGIGTSGSPNANMAGCKIGTNGIAQCNGHDLNADVASAVGGTDNCAAGGSGLINQQVIPDPYSGLAAGLPSNTCSNPTNKASYPQTAQSNKLSGSVTWGAKMVFCGNVNLTGNVTVTTPASSSGGTVMVIENGALNIGSNTLTTATGSGLTIIFTGPAVTGLTGVTPIITGGNGSNGGTLDIAAPSANNPNWPASASGMNSSGIAVYQDPNLKNNSQWTVDWSSAGNSPTLNVSGLLYLPNAAVTFKGVVNKASNGLDCFALVDDTFSSNGTTTILEHQSQCGQAGLTPPQGGSTRTALVQ